jgi:hypothetical protein
LLGLPFDREDGAVIASESSANFHRTVRRYISEDSILLCEGVIMHAGFQFGGGGPGIFLSALQ